MPKKSTRRARRVAKRSKTKKSKKWFLVILLPAALLVLYFLFFAKQSFFDKTRNLSIAVAKDDGSVDVVVVNPIEETVNTITVPADMEVRAARGLGTWRIKSIWKLGEQEKVSGKLLSQTVTNFFNFPTEAWADESFSKNPIAARNTNLSLLDKIRLTIFINRVKAVNKRKIDLAQLGVAKSVRLTDGEDGYRLSGEMPASVLAVFGETNISKEGFIVTVEDETGTPGVARKVGEIIEVLGAKVASVSGGENATEGCTVIGPDSVTTEKISKIFSCKKEKSAEKDISVKVILGKNFGENF